MVFIDIKEDCPTFLLKEVYEIRNVMYTYIDDKEEIEKIKQGFEKDGLDCFIEDGVLYITGIDRKNKERIEAGIKELTEKMEAIRKFEAMPNPIINDYPKTDDYEKDYIDRLAEKYRKEAEDKGKLN